MLTKSKSTKKIICSILAVVFIVTSLSISAFAVDYPASKTVTTTSTYNITVPCDQIQIVINAMCSAYPTKSYSEPHYSAVLPLTSSYISSQSPFFDKTYPYYPGTLYNYTVTLVYSGVVNYQP